MSPPTKTTLSAWLPVIFALAGIILWVAQLERTDGVQDVQIERLQIDVMTLSVTQPKILESLARIETRLDITKENDE